MKFLLIVAVGFWNCADHLPVCDQDHSPVRETDYQFRRSILQYRGDILLRQRDLVLRFYVDVQLFDCAFKHHFDDFRLQGLRLLGD